MDEHASGYASPSSSMGWRMRAPTQQAQLPPEQADLEITARSGERSIPRHCIALIRITIEHSQVRTHPNQPASADPSRPPSTRPAYQHREHSPSPVPSSPSSGFAQPHAHEHRQDTAPEPMRYAFAYPGGWPDHSQRFRVHYTLTSPLSPLLSSPRYNPDESFAYPLFGPAPYTVVNDQNQQLEDVPRLLHGFRPPNPPRPPERLHSALSSWLKDMNKLSDLIDRLRGLASAASAVHRPRLYRQVATLRAAFKRQQERCIEFLRLTEGYSGRYLHDISAEIQRQRSFLDMLEKRVDKASTLYEQAVDLRKSYDSGTASAMKNARDTGKDAFYLLREV